MKNEEKVLIVDFGGQYKELIARRVRECGVLSLIVPHTKSAQEIADMKPIGLIFTGGPQSAYAPDAPRCDRRSSPSACRCSASATGCSSCATCWAGRCPPASAANTAL